MRIVLDTNVLARAIRGGTGPAAELLGIVMVPPHTFILSPFLLSELARVLRYERMRKLHKLDDAQLDAYVQSLQSAALVVNPPSGTATSVVSADPDDDPIVATAVAGQAEVLCTRDHHLQSPAVRAYCSGAGIQVLTDIELLQILRASSGSATPP
jgi:putative PIN family toxin of toxin-antitoxin system